MPNTVLKESVKLMLDQAWTAPGFCVPNPTTYRYQWLWDSCFHAIIWAELGSDRGLLEMQNVLASQHSSGFVPHMTYWGEPDAHADFWGQSNTSTITQPPMYGHALAELVRKGFDPSQELFAKSRAGLEYLLRRPRTQAGLVPAWHPWETGCDNSARWDDWVGSDTGFDFDTWRQRKSEFVFALKTDSHGAVISSPFEVGSVGLNALIAWNIAELGSIGESNPALDAGAEQLSQAIAKRWNGELKTWTDSDSGSGQVRTLDAMLPLLVDPRPAAFDELADQRGFGAPFGPRGVHLEEPTYDPDEYWRGPAWPQLCYLIYVAACRAGHDSARELGGQLIAGATKSDLAEYWNPETGQGRGAIPQTWAGLALCVV